MRKIAFFSVWLLVFAIPWENIIFLPGIGTASRMFGLGALFIGLASVLILEDEIRLHLLHRLMFCFVMWGGWSYYWSIDPIATLHRGWTYLQLLIMIWLVYQWAPRIKDLNALLCAYVLGAYLSAFNLIINYFRDANWQRYAALGFNPNDIAIIMALGIPISWYLLQINWGGRLKFIFFLYPFLAPVCIALTASRSGLIAALAALSFVVWTLPRLSNRYKAACVAAACIGIWAGLSFVPLESWGRLGTTSNELTSGGWNSRFSIWKAGLEAFASDPVLSFVGMGAGSFRAAVEPILGIGAASHNVFLAVMVEQGLVGFSIFGLILSTALFSAMRMPKLERGLWLVLLVTWGISAFAHPWEWRKQTWLLFALVVAHAVALKSQTSSHQNAAQ